MQERRKRFEEVQKKARKREELLSREREEHKRLSQEKALLRSKEIERVKEQMMCRHQEFVEKMRLKKEEEEQRGYGLTRQRMIEYVIE